MTDPQSLVERLAGEAGQSAHLPDAIKAHPAFKAFTRKFSALIANECARLESEPGVYMRHDMADAIRQRFGVGD